MGPFSAAGRQKQCICPAVPARAVANYYQLLRRANTRRPNGRNRRGSTCGYSCDSDNSRESFMTYELLSVAAADNRRLRCTNQSEFSTWLRHHGVRVRRSVEDGIQREFRPVHARHWSVLVDVLSTLSGGKGGLPASFRPRPSLITDWEQWPNYRHIRAYACQELVLGAQC